MLNYIKIENMLSPELTKYQIQQLGLDCTIVGTGDRRALVVKVTDAELVNTVADIVVLSGSYQDNATSWDIKQLEGE